MDFVPLHCHSMFSFHAGVASVSELVRRARDLGMPALALTDTDRVSGLIKFYLECRAQGVKPILGVELTSPVDPGKHIVALARNATGYGDLCEIVTRRQVEPQRFDLVQTFACPWPNLTLLTSFPELLEDLAHTPNRGRLAGELINNSRATRARGRCIERCARALGLPLVATNNSFFIEPGDWETHRILRAIGLNSTLSRLDRAEVASPAAHFRRATEMVRAFPSHRAAVAYSAEIAAQCSAELELGSWILPIIDVPGGGSPDAHLRRLALFGLERNYGSTAEHDRAVQIQRMELEVIAKLGYSSYFLFVKEIRDWANERFRTRYRRPTDCTILRGSAANSITFYNIGVSDLDPIRYDLYFQRFLNEDRASPPDADLDFAWDEREEVYDYIVDRWGQDRVAVTCTTNHFRRRAAFRETAKVHGFSDDEVTRILESLSTRSRRIDDREVSEVLDRSQAVVGKPRFLGQHPGGLIITNQPIWRHVGCELSGGDNNRMITQIDMHNGIDELGLIKFDILGNGSLAVLRDVLLQLEEQGIVDPEVWDLDKCYADSQVQSILKRGRTRGIFYIESPAQMRLNQKAEAETFEEVTITSSLIRPAGTVYTKTYVERQRQMKRGIRDWEFLHPSLEPILGETHDVCAFQEDVTKICHQVAGLGFRRADRIRKMMNSLHEGAVPADEWEQVRREFIDGCSSHSGVGRPQAEELWQRVSSFTGFSFCKSHSAAYAQLSFQCAYLKTRYPAQFLAAVVTNGHGFYSKEVYLNEARRWGVRILPLHVNQSAAGYRGHDDWIRPGLMHVRGLRSATVGALVRERSDGGPFRSLPDFLQRVPKVNRAEGENLILVGGFAGWGASQPELLFQLDGLIGRRPRGIPQLFDGSALRTADESLPEAEPHTLTERCLNEMRLLGFMLSGNILDILDLHPASRGAVPTRHISDHVGRRIKVFGWPVTERVHQVRSAGKNMLFITIEDMTECADVILWPDVYERFSDALVERRPLEIWGTVSEDWNTCSLEADYLQAVEWSPGLIDFELAGARLAGSFAPEYIYADIRAAGAA